MAAERGAPGGSISLQSEPPGMCARQEKSEMLRPLREQMEACVQRLEAGTLEADDLRGLFTVILEALPSLEPPGRQVRHLAPRSRTPPPRRGSAN